MSTLLDQALSALNAKISGAGMDGSAKFVINGEGALMIDGDGVRIAEESEEADVTMSADADVFEGILSGGIDPASAFMGGKLSVDGDMGKAMQLASVLA